MQPSLIPFSRQHLLELIPRDGDALESYDMVDIKERNPSYTAVIDDTILGCAGVVICWSGFGFAWAVFSKELLERYPIWTTRTTRRMLLNTICEHKLHRVEMVVLEDSAVNRNWPLVFGFRRELAGVARYYTAQKKAVVRYEIVFE